MANKITLASFGAQMTGGFAASDKKIASLDASELD
jgi:hypothetical protein